MDLERDGVEAVWVELRTKVGTILIEVIYCPPNTSAQTTKVLCEMFETVAQEGKEMVIMGDFNMNMLSPNAGSRQLQSTAFECNLRRLISEPTRVTNNSRTVIGLLFTSHPESFERAGCADVLDSDHAMIYGVYCKGRERRLPPHVKTIRSFKNSDADELIQDLENAPWSLMDTFDTVDRKWEYWKTTFLSVVDRHAPLRKVRVREHSSPWITEEVLKLTRARNYYHTKHRKTKSLDDWATYTSHSGMLPTMPSGRRRQSIMKKFVKMCPAIDLEHGNS